MIAKSKFHVEPAISPFLFSIPFTLTWVAWTELYLIQDWNQYELSLICHRNVHTPQETPPEIHSTCVLKAEWDFFIKDNPFKKMKLPPRSIFMA